MAILTDLEMLTYLEASGQTLSPQAVAALKMLQPKIDRVIDRALGWKVAQQSFSEFHPEVPIGGQFDRDDQVAGFELVGQLVMPRMRGAKELRYINLRNLPVRSLTNIWDNEAAFLGGTAGGDWPAANILDPSAYSLDQAVSGISWTGMVVRNYGVWGTMPRTIRVDYVAGLTADELDADYGDIKLAALETVASHLMQAVARSRAAKVGGIPTSVSGENFSVSMQTVLGAANAEMVLPQAAAVKLAEYVNVSRWFGR